MGSYEIEITENSAGLYVAEPGVFVKHFYLLNIPLNEGPFALGKFKYAYASVFTKAFVQLL